MKRLLIFTLFLASCKTFNFSVAVPDKFAANATQMKVAGLNGWPTKHLTFGNYRTSRVRSGWLLTSGTADRSSGVTQEERLLKVFKMSHENITRQSKNKYHYTIQDGDLLADVYCLEKSSKEVITSSTPLGDFSKLNNYQYSFSAAILPQTIKDEQWQLVFYNSYDREQDTTHSFLQLPNITREGYVTNGKIRIDIHAILTDKVVTKDGKETKTPIKLLMAYELKIDGGLIGIVDVFKNTVWIYNDLDKDMKLVLASVSSAILMRQLAEAKA
jgi:hypothetical protein